ncbi:MAG: hypothetical protein QME41_00810, partial [Actinomycetota bacterium]|nr:hypothetical protein [Actinomycetota bacterium]
MSVLCSAKEGKRKTKRLGKVDIIEREQYERLELDSKVELIRALIPIGLMHIQELLDEEVRALAGERYARKDETSTAYRHGSNPASVRIAGQRVPIELPRVRSAGGKEIPLRAHAT